MLLEQTGQDEHCQHHTGHPADAQLNQKAQCILSLLTCSGKQSIQRTDKLIVKSQQECDRTAGHTRDAVCQRHEKTTDNMHDVTSFIFLYCTSPMPFKPHRIF